MTDRPLAFMPNQWKMKGHSQIKHFLRCDKQKKRQPAINGRRFTMPAREMLAKSVMQILADAPLLALADFEIFLFQPFAFGNVADEARENPPVAQLHFADGQINRKQSAVLFARERLAPDADDFGV